MKRKEDFPEDFAITKLIETDPRSKITDSSTYIRQEEDNPNKIVVYIPCRSDTTLKLLLPSDVRKHMFRALGLWKFPGHGAVSVLYGCVCFREIRILTALFGAGDGRVCGWLGEAI
jgi:hypothetical protein